MASTTVAGSDVRHFTEGGFAKVSVILGLTSASLELVAGWF